MVTKVRILLRAVEVKFGKLGAAWRHFFIFGPFDPLFIIWLFARKKKVQI